MKKRKTLKEILSKYKTAILAVFEITLFVVCILLLLNFIYKPLSDSQFELCEQIAQEAYNQRKNVMIEAPEDFDVSMTGTTIKVEMKSSSEMYRGYIIAKLKNGELVITRYPQTAERIVTCIICGLVLAFLINAIVMLAAIIRIATKKQVK